MDIKARITKSQNPLRTPKGKIITDMSGAHVYVYHIKSRETVDAREHMQKYVTTMLTLLLEETTFDTSKTLQLSTDPKPYDWCDRLKHVTDRLAMPDAGLTVGIVDNYNRCVREFFTHFNMPDTAEFAQLNIIIDKRTPSSVWNNLFGETP